MKHPQHPGDSITPPRADGRCRLAWLVKNGRTLAFGSSYQTTGGEEIMKWSYWEELAWRAVDVDPIDLIDGWMDEEAES